MLRLIIAEDEPATRENMIACIDWKQLGFEIVGVAEDGESALQLIQAEEPDIVLIDIRMPVMSGLEVIRHIREGDVLFPVFIIISGYDSFSYAQEALNLRVDGYLLKPFSPDELLTKLQQAISRTSVANHLLIKPPPAEGEGRQARRPGDAERIHYPYDREQQLINCIAAGDRAQADAAADAFLDEARSANRDNYRYYHCFLIIYAEICRYLSRGGYSFGPLQGLGGHSAASLEASIRSALHEAVRSALDQMESADEAGILIRRVQEYLNEHYAEKLKLDDISRKVHISPAYLSSLFSKRTGMTITNYLQSVRIEASKALLRDLRYSLSDVAAMVGYPDTKYFSQVFKQVYGITPSAYRNSTK